MDWTRRATINEQTDGTTVDSRVLINFLHIGAPVVELISNTREFIFLCRLSRYSSYICRSRLCTRVTFKRTCIPKIFMKRCITNARSTDPFAWMVYEMYNYQRNTNVICTEIQLKIETVVENSQISIALKYILIPESKFYS